MSNEPEQEQQEQAPPPEPWWPVHPDYNKPDTELGSDE